MLCYVVIFFTCVTFNEFELCRYFLYGVLVRHQLEVLASQQLMLVKSLQYQVQLSFDQTCGSCNKFLYANAPLCYCGCMNRR
jgi:hypothetical protein